MTHTNYNKLQKTTTMGQYGNSKHSSKAKNMTNTTCYKTQMGQSQPPHKNAKIGGRNGFPPASTATVNMKNQTPFTSRKSSGETPAQQTITTQNQEIYHRK